MRLSLFRAGAVAFGASIALAACGGHGVVPSSPTAMNPAFAPMHHHRASCPQPAWVFKGACKVGKASPKGFTISLPAYKGYAVSISVPANSAKAGTPFALVDATGKGDIGAYKGKAFPLCTSKTGCSKPAFFYIQSVNGGTTPMTLKSGNISFVLTANKFPGTSCTLAYFTGSSWTSLQGIVSGKIKGKKLTYSIPGQLINAQGGIKPGPLYVAPYCS
jgi:hypothetical protein